MNLILHIGEAKTGTTSIQNALLYNKKALMKSGILCPLVTPSDHFYIWFLLGGPPNVSETVLKKLQKKALKTLTKIKITVDKKKIDTILLSAEPFFDLSSNQLKKLLSLMDVNISTIRIIAYIRNPADLYFSSTQELLKANYIYTNPYLWKRNLLPQLLLWEENIGKENIRLRPYNREHFPQGNVVLDFFQQLEILSGRDIPKVLCPDRNYNQSLSAEQMILFQNYRKDFLYDHNGLAHLKSNILLRYFYRINSIHTKFGTKAKLKPHLKNVLYENNIDYYRKIDDHFGADFCNDLFRKKIFIEPPTQKDESAYVDVSDILESYSPEAVDALKSSIPEYSTFKTGSLSWFYVFFKYYSSVFINVGKSRLARLAGYIKNSS